MAASWTDTYGSTSRLFGRATLDLGQMLWGALRDRYAALSGVGVGSSTLDALTFPLPAAEDNASRKPGGSLHMGDLPTASSRYFPVNQIQYLIQTHLVPAYLDPRTVAALPSASKPQSWASFNDFATYVGLNSGGTGTGWRRRTIRKIASTTAAADTEGNAAADGQKARIAATGANYVRASGAWVPGTIEDIPDKLDSTSAAPNHCAPGWSNPDTHDIIGPWIYNEVVAALNKLYITRRGWTTSSNCPTYQYEQKTAQGLDQVSSGGNTLATAQSLAEEGWSDVTRFSGGYSRVVSPGEETAAGTWIGESGVGAVGTDAGPFQMQSQTHHSTTSGSHGVVDTFAGNYVANLCRVLASRLCYKAGIAGKAHLLVKASAYTSGFTNYEFDTNGLVGTTADQWGIKESADITTIDSGSDGQYFSLFGNLSDEPVWASDNGRGTDTVRGALFYFDVIMEWKFTQGDYAPSSDTAPSNLTNDCPA